MPIIQNFTTKDEKAFQNFATVFALTEIQKEQFKRYLDLLLEWNERYNLTTITDPELIIQDHFTDSIMLTQFLDFKKVNAIADIGSGAGFPGIPLKIINPTIPVYLIEVNTKRIRFLKAVIAQLHLNNIEICALDWRTFLRKTNYPINLFVSRASLHTDELVKMFKPSSLYKEALLVYWASQHWTAESYDMPFLKGEFSYMLNNKKRSYVCFAHNSLTFDNLQQSNVSIDHAKINNLK